MLRVNDCSGLDLAFMVCACVTTSAARYPLDWPNMQTDPGLRCAIQGRFKNVGKIERQGVSTFPTVAYLSALLVDGTSSPADKRSQIESVKLEYRQDSLLVSLTPASTEFPNSRLTGGLASCERIGSHRSYWSRPYVAEGNAGVQHITLFLEAATDGSLIVKSVVMFDGSKSVFPRKHFDISWYRFNRLDAGDTSQLDSKS
jgi:hypothetical protein